jgi:hypothetical protein
MSVIADTMASASQEDWTGCHRKYTLAVRMLIQANPDLTESSAARLVNALMEQIDPND